MEFFCVMLLIFTGFRETTSENFKVVGPAAPLVVEAGEDLALPCSLQPNISAEDMMVEWIRTDLTESNALVHLYKDHKDTNGKQMKSYRGRTALFKEDLQRGNTSLKLSAVRPSDKGSYQCAVKSESWYDDIIVQVEVKVHLKVVGPVDPLVVEAGADLVLPCSIEPSTSAEDMTVGWIRLHLHSDNTNALVHLYKDYKVIHEKQMETYGRRTALFKEELKKGNTSLKLSAVQPSDEGVYQCYIEYRSWRDEVTVYVEVKERSFHAWKIAVICISVFGTVLTVFTAYILKDKYTEKELSPKQCSVIAYMRIQSEHVTEKLDLKKYKTSEEGYRRLIPAVTKCRKARFAGCNLTAESTDILSAALQTENSLKELDISNNELQDSGVELLSAGLESSHCRLETVRLADCKLRKQSCNTLRSVLQSKNSSLKELDLSNNDLEDSGVELLSAGLKSSHCKLETLRLSGCMVTEVGCSCLASALSSNPSHLKELDLTYNHPGESGLQLLSARLEDPHCSLKTLSMENGGEMRIKPGLKKYSCDLTLDPNTAHMRLSLCEGNRKVVCLSPQQERPDSSERFDWWEQVLCRESVTGRCYWEAEWSTGWVYVALTYKTLRRKGRSDDCLFGRNEKSWSLYCSNNRYSAQHNTTIIDIPAPHSSSKTVGVYVDCPAGSLSFYSVSPDTHTLTHLHTFSTTFTEPLCAGFGLRCYDSSLCVKEAQ